MTNIKGRAVYLLLAVSLVAACGGGGGGSSSPSAPPGTPPSAPNGLGRAETIGNGAFQGAPQIAVSSNGDVFIAWVALTGGQQRIMVERFENGAWRAPETIDGFTGPTQNGIYPSIAADASGNAVAVWLQSDSSQQTPDLGSIWAARYTSNAGWSVPVRIMAVGQTVFLQAPHVAMNATGTALAVWAQYDSVNNVDRIHANSLRPGQINWDGPVLIDRPVVANHYGYAPYAALDSDGNAVVAWNDYDSSSSAVDPDSIYANRMSASGVWSGAVLVRTFAAGDDLDSGAATGRPVQAVMVTTNHPLIVWSERAAQAGLGRVQLATYAATWSSTDQGSAAAFSLSAGGGQAMLAVSRDTQNPNNDVRPQVYRYTPVGGLDSGTFVEAPGSMSAPILVAMNGSGQAMTVWERRVLDPNQPNPPPSALFASRFNGTSWSSAQALDNPGLVAGQMVPYGLGFDNAGFATIISHKVENGAVTAQYRNRFQIP